MCMAGVVVVDESGVSSAGGGGIDAHVGDPVALAPREPVLRAFAVEVGMRAAQRRGLDVLERMDVDDRIAAAVDLAADERHDTAGGADVEGRGARAEAVAGHE